MKHKFLTAALAAVLAVACAPAVAGAAPSEAAIPAAIPAANLGDTINTAVRGAIDANPKATLAELQAAAKCEPPWPAAAALQSAVESALETTLITAKASADDASKALDEAEADLRRDGLFTPPVEAAFRTARAAVAAQKAAGPNAGFGAPGPVGSPPSVSGGGGSQTGTYAPPQT
jgi:hypothetical protein